MGDDIFHFFKPESGHLIQNHALAGDGIRHNNVKSGNAIGGYNQQIITDGINIAHLAATDQIQFVEVCFLYAFYHKNKFLLAEKWIVSFFMSDGGGRCAAVIMSGHDFGIIG